MIRLLCPADKARDDDERLLVAAFLASAFAIGGANACGYGKTAKQKQMVTASTTVKTEQAVSTFDPASKPIFEEKAEGTETAKPIKKPVVE